MHCSLEISIGRYLTNLIYLSAYTIMAYNFVGKKGVKYSVSIERNTHLLVVDNGENYIRLTGQQLDKLKRIIFVGEFASKTRPINRFELIDNGDTFLCRCPEEHQTLRIHLDDMHKVFDYYNRHIDHIERYDLRFRKKR